MPPGSLLRQADRMGTRAPKPTATSAARPLATTAPDTARARPWLIVSGAAIGWAMVTMTVLHIVSAHNPVLDTISSYAGADDGDKMLPTSVLSLALGSLALLGALWAARIPTGRTTQILFGSWSCGLLVAAVFPASFVPGGDSWSGRIHQYAALVAFLSLPGVGFSLAERLRELPAFDRARFILVRVSRLSVLSLGLFGLSYALAWFPGAPVLDQLSTLLPVGLTQRVALIVDFTLLSVIMLLVARTIREARADAPTPLEAET